MRRCLGACPVRVPRCRDCVLALRRLCGWHLPTRELQKSSRHAHASSSCIAASLRVRPRCELRARGEAEAGVGSRVRRARAAFEKPPARVRHGLPQPLGHLLDLVGSHPQREAPPVEHLRRLGREHVVDASHPERMPRHTGGQITLKHIHLGTQEMSRPQTYFHLGTREMNRPQTHSSRHTEDQTASKTSISAHRR